VTRSSERGQDERLKLVPKSCSVKNKCTLCSDYIKENLVYILSAVIASIYLG
jgi:hypothetical protein